MGDFNHPKICCRDNTTGHKQSRTSCFDDNFLLQVAEEPARRGAMLDLVLTSRKQLVGNVNFKCSKKCSDNELLRFKIPKMARRLHSKVPLPMARGPVVSDL